MCLAKVSEWDHAWEQGDASPPEIRGFGPAEVTVHALVRHHRSEKNQVRSEQEVESNQQRIGNRNEERADREQDYETDDRAAEVVDFEGGVACGKSKALR